VWTDRAIDWRAFDLVIVRSCWDYHLRIAEFRAWIYELEKDGVRLLNPPDVLRWNMHKGYLLELQSKGVLIPKTTLIDDRGDVVVKPAISASAHATQRMSGDIVLQEFVPEVLAAGEWSLMFFDRIFSHAVKKLPKAGDFRTQEELGGASTAMLPPAHVLAAADRVLGCVDDDILYARVDMVEREAGVTLMELELIEPGLFLEKDAVAARRFASAIAARISA
jgi:glutathione synthase/RimK-type ligase-like ATP-grasp enzyme